MWHILYHLVRPRGTPWLLAAAVLGGLVGASIDQLPIGSFARGVVATVLAWVFSLIFMALGWRFLSPFASEIGVPVASVRTLFVALLLAGLVGSLAHHAGLGFQMPFRTVLLGIVGAVLGTFQGLLTGASEALEEA